MSRSYSSSYPFWASDLTSATRHVLIGCPIALFTTSPSTSGPMPHCRHVSMSHYFTMAISRASLLGEIARALKSRHFSYSCSISIFSPCHEPPQTLCHVAPYDWFTFMPQPRQVNHLATTCHYHRYLATVNQRSSPVGKIARMCHMVGSRFPFATSL